MAEELITKCAQLQKNDKSAIIDFNNIVFIEEAVVKEIEIIHTQFYSRQLSFAICAAQPEIKALFSTELNIVHTLDEAIDIISMEGLERELLGEE